MTSTVVHCGMLIDGAPVDSEDTVEVRDPGRNSDVVGVVAVGDERHVQAAVAAAHAGEAVWRATPVAERITVLNAAADAVQGQVDELTPLLSRENGGTPLESRLDLTRALELFHDLLARAPAFLAPKVVDNASEYLAIEKAPIGITALIVPWNSPIVLTLSKLAPALVAGNTVIVKPPLEAPLALNAVLSRIAQFLPPGVLNVVHGAAVPGQMLVSHPAVRKIAFTGSVASGGAVMAAAAATIKNVSLELGGNDAAIILDDADLEALMPQLARGIFTRAGQICFAVKRVYLPERLYDAGFDALRTVVDDYRVGHQLDPATTLGPLISERERDRVVGLIDRARAAGDVQELGRAVDADELRDGYYVRPTLVRDIHPSAELVRVEQFGPVIPLVRYGSVDEAVAMANDSEFGLASSVWSSDPDRALAVARRLEAGVTFVNSHNLPSLSFDVPFGGVKRSGLGRERTEAGLAEYVEDHAIRWVRPT